MTELQAVRAVYKSGRLIFTDPQKAPQDGSEVIVTYLAPPSQASLSKVDPIQALRGRGKGESLMEKLLQARCEDRSCPRRS